MKRLCIQSLLLLLFSALVFAGGQKGVEDDGGPRVLTFFGSIGEGATLGRHDNPVYKEIVRRTGVELEFDWGTAGSDAEKLNLMLAGESLPDIIMQTYGDNITKQLVNSGQLVDLEPYIEEHGPNIKKHLGKYFDIWKNQSPTGELLFIKNETGMPIATLHF